MNQLSSADKPEEGQIELLVGGGSGGTNLAAEAARLPAATERVGDVLSARFASQLQVRVSISQAVGKMETSSALSKEQDGISRGGKCQVLQAPEMTKKVLFFAKMQRASNQLHRQSKSTQA